MTVILNESGRSFQIQAGSYQFLLEQERNLNFGEHFEIKEIEIDEMLFQENKNEFFINSSWTTIVFYGYFNSFLIDTKPNQPFTIVTTHLLLNSKV